jgi:hypothetical protein
MGQAHTLGAKFFQHLSNADKPGLHIAGQRQQFWFCQRVKGDCPSVHSIAILLYIERHAQHHSTSQQKG